MKNICINGKEYDTSTTTNIHYGLLQWLDDKGYYHRIDGPSRVIEGCDNQWYIHGKEITNEVEEWIAENNITWPFDKETQIEFLLKFAYHTI